MKYKVKVTKKWITIIKLQLPNSALAFDPLTNWQQKAIFSLPFTLSTNQQIVYPYFIIVSGRIPKWAALCQPASHPNVSQSATWHLTGLGVENAMWVWPHSGAKPKNDRRRLQRYAPTKENLVETYLSINQHQSAWVSIHYHPSASISTNQK